MILKRKNYAYKMDFLLNRATEMGDNKETNPITSVIIVADRNKCPQGFLPITKTFDEQIDGDVWRESSFSFFSRPVRYIAVSRETPLNTIGAHVVTDLCVVKDSDPIPMGFIAIDFTADSKEKALRKKYLCVRSVARDTVLDAVGEIILLSKQKKPPRNYSSAGEIDGILVCFKYVVIPASFGIGLPRSQSTIAGIYPNVAENFRRSAPSLDQITGNLNSMNALTIKTGTQKRGIEDVPFKLNPILEKSMLRNQLNVLPELKVLDEATLEREYGYRFTVERATLSHS
ncbi:unnamed protein product [Dracunculus medinensis]|uniref:Protein FAM125A n=1 Tax=Dracunculus medinensis TaxID=318479 RepID=A0A0N4ULC2_DRAME|nr:unnamed protein product [Dracunculus medinensis]